MRFRPLALIGALALHIAIGTVLLFGCIGLFAGSWWLVDTGRASATTVEVGHVLLASVLSYLASRAERNWPRI